MTPESAGPVDYAMGNGEVAKCASVVGCLSSRSALETGKEVVMLGGKRDRVLAALGFVLGTGLVAALITSGSSQVLGKAWHGPAPPKGTAGSTGRTAPTSLAEKLAMEQVRSNPGAGKGNTGGPQGCTLADE